MYRWQRTVDQGARWRILDRGFEKLLYAERELMQLPVGAPKFGSALLHFRFQFVPCGLLHEGRAGMAKPRPTFGVIVSILQTQWLVAQAMQDGMEVSLAGR
jgi:hypothetical protein